MCNQVPEAFGPVRTLAEGKQDELFVGTTRNSVLRGSFSGSLTPIVQVGCQPNIYAKSQQDYHVFSVFSRQTFDYKRHMPWTILQLIVAKKHPVKQDKTRCNIATVTCVYMPDMVFLNYVIAQ